MPSLSVRKLETAYINIAAKAQYFDVASISASLSRSFSRILDIPFMILTTSPKWSRGQSRLGSAMVLCKPL